MLHKDSKLLLILLLLGPDWYRYVRDQAQENPEGTNQLPLDYELDYVVAQTSSMPTHQNCSLSLSPCQLPPRVFLMTNRLKEENLQHDILAPPGSGKLQDHQPTQGWHWRTRWRKSSPGQPFEQHMSTVTEVRDGQRYGSTLMQERWLTIWLDGQGLGSWKFQEVPVWWQGNLGKRYVYEPLGLWDICVSCKYQPKGIYWSLMLIYILSFLTFITLKTYLLYFSPSTLSSLQSKWPSLNKSWICQFSLKTPLPPFTLHVKGFKCSPHQLPTPPQLRAPPDSRHTKCFSVPQTTPHSILEGLPRTCPSVWNTLST